MIVKQALNTNVRYGDCPKGVHCWAELILLYEDGTWESIFEYRWTDTYDIKRINTGRLKGKTRCQVIDILENEFYKGSLSGVFNENPRFSRWDD